MKVNSTIVFSVFLVMTLFVTEVVFAYSRVGGFSGSFQGYDYTQPRQIIHTVEKNESLWQIAQQFDVDFTKLAEINGLDNPDLIFPGNKLVIKIQGTFINLQVIDIGPVAGSQVADHQLAFLAINFTVLPAEPAVIKRDIRFLAAANHDRELGEGKGLALIGQVLADKLCQAGGCGGRKAGHGGDPGGGGING